MNIYYQKATKEFFEENLTGFIESFSEHEPMGKALGITPEELVPLFRYSLWESMEYSFIAIDLSTGKVVGGVICNDLLFFLESSSGPFSDKMNTIISLLEQMEASFVADFGPFKNKDYLYHFATYVVPSYKGQDIATRLYQISEQAAAAKGFQNVMTVSTGLISQHIRIDKLGFRKVKELPYKSFWYEGQTVFEALDSTSCMTLVKKLPNVRIFFVLGGDKTDVIGWGNLTAEKNLLLILITGEVLKNKLEKKGIDKCFFHIETFDIMQKVSENVSSEGQYFGSCFDYLKTAIPKTLEKLGLVGSPFGIVSGNEEIIMDCAALREFFGIEGDKKKDVLRFLNKDIMKKRLLEMRIDKRFLPKYTKLDKSAFAENPLAYVKKTIAELGLPIFAKPVMGSGSAGIKKITSAESLERWCHEHFEDIREYEMDEYIEGELYHCASIIKDGKIVHAFVSKYLNPCADSLLENKLLGSMILDQSSPMAIKIKAFNEVVIAAMQPISDCAMHHEMFVKQDGSIVFVEVANRVIEGGYVAEMFGEQFGINFREADMALRLGIANQELLKQKPPQVFYATIASVPVKNKKITELLPPPVASQYKYLLKPETGQANNTDAEYITLNNMEMLFWNDDPKKMEADFESLKNYSPFKLS